MSFDWNDLQHFLAVARAGTVSLAARRMGLNHSTLIRRIEALEHALGTTLFERQPRGYTLTARGERLLVTAEAIEVEAVKVGRDVVSAASQVGGIVRISTLEGFGNYFIAPRLPQLATRHPNLTVELSIVQQDNGLLRRDSDVAVLLFPSESDGLSCERLTDFGVHLYATRDYLDRHAPIVERADLFSHTLCSYIDRVSFIRGVDYLKDISSELEAKIQSSSLSAQMAAICEHYGLGMLPAFVARTRPELVRVLPDSIGLTRSYWLVSSSNASAGARVHAARRFIREAAAKAGPAFFMG